MTVAVNGSRDDVRPTYVAEMLEILRVIVVVGVPLGILVAGGGGRLAMLLLRLTSPEWVRGTLSDDGFVIGEVTLAGTYGLLVLGAVVGLIGAAAYIAVAPWLLGPQWARAATVGVTAGALVGSMVIHADGRDFTLLEPELLAVGLFIALPTLFGVLLVYAVDAAARPGHWTARGRRRRVLVPLVLLALVPQAIFVGLPVALVVALLLPLRRAFLERIRGSATGTFIVRAGFLVIPALSFVALARDVDAVLG
jgi:hypothetical protein